MNTIYRIGKPSDSEALAQLSGIRENNFWLNKPIDLEDLRQSFSDKLTRSLTGKARMVVAEIHGVAVGYAAANFGEARAHVEYEIAPCQQRRGLGKALLGLLLEEDYPDHINGFFAVCHNKNWASLRILSAHEFICIGPWSETSGDHLMFFRTRRFRT